MLRAVSRRLFGTEEHHLLNRLLTSLELILHPQNYDTSQSNDTDKVCWRSSGPADGNCMLSRGLFATGEHHLLTSLLTSLKLIQHLQNYDTSHPRTRCVTFEYIMIRTIA